MPSLPLSQTIVATWAFYGKGERWQCVMPWVADAPLNKGTSSVQMLTAMQTALRAKWLDCLSEDCELQALQAEGGEMGNCIPYRINIPAGDQPGTVVGEMYSQNVSMMLVRQAGDQVISGSRIRTGKMFIGPPPESKCNAQHILNAFLSGPLATFRTAVQTGFTDAGGLNWKMALSLATHGVGPLQVYVCDYFQMRTTVFTQKRRLQPLV